MKRTILLLLSLLLLAGCGGNAAAGSYQQITQEEAKEMMDNQEVIILDVREQDEYDGGHIPGAMLLPVGMINEETAAGVIPGKDATVLPLHLRCFSLNQRSHHWPTVQLFPFCISSPPFGNRTIPQKERNSYYFIAPRMSHLSP